MTIWSAEIKELESLYVSLKGKQPDLEKELDKLIKAEDENIALLYSRRCLEVIITDLCEKELNRPRKTEPLKGIIDKLNKEEKVPSHIITSMLNLNSLSTYGAHPKEFDPEQVKPVLNNLSTIIKWYIKYKDTKTTDTTKPKEVKEEVSSQEDSTEQIQKPKNKLILLLSGLALVIVIVVVALFVFDIIGEGKQTKELEKSIAVLPFFNDSQDEENQHIINGLTEGIRQNLQAIKDIIRVPGRESVEQYRNSLKPIPEIGKELNVDYIVRGSGQKIGNRVLLYIDLFDSKNEKNLLPLKYDREILKVEDQIDIQSEIARLIAEEIEAIITPEEEQLIEKIPTTDTTAYDFYLRGQVEMSKIGLFKDNRDILKRAEEYLYKALEYDTTYALAYAGLARVYYYKDLGRTVFSEDHMDSVLILANIALSYDEQLAEAYSVKGVYYTYLEDIEQAITEFDKALILNPNDWLLYYAKGSLYTDYDLVLSIENLHRAASLNRGSELPNIFGLISRMYSFAGFTDKAIHYNYEALKLNHDSIVYYDRLGSVEYVHTENAEKAIESFKKGYAIDSNYFQISYQLGLKYTILGQYEEALKYFERFLEVLKAQGVFPGIDLHWIGYVYGQKGYKEEEEYWFKEQINYCNKSIELGRSIIFDFTQSYYYLAGVYAFKGEKDKAYESLRNYLQKQSIPKWMVLRFQNDPLFDSIRDEPEFQQIVRDVEAKYQAEHERVRLWLEENDML